MTAPDIIAQLVERFDRNRDGYRSDRYNETQLRREFLDPFFDALGWDVSNLSGHADAYKDVIHEDAINIGSATKAPDYSFRIGGTRKFFLEAKKPAVDIQKDPAPAFQLRRYAWSAKLPLSILTDFEELAVYDCRVKPAQSDKASAARVKLIPYTDYLARWDEIADIFSKSAVLQGSFDKYARTERAKRGTAEVDDAFLAEIESWRDTLAHNIALRNPALDNRQLNYAVQITIDRLIFLRIAEDRGIERYGELLALVNGPDIFPRLQKLFEKADNRYNSGLFHFTKEKDRPEGPDELTPGLTIDDKPLKDILKSVYYPDSPYEFSVLPAEILGQVYEQFLGKVITLTAGHRAKVEEKPEVKKAGGVYYTPAYIVKYIVENTVGKLVEGKTPAEVAKLKILDPACGSGSFLLGAYQFLLDWHLKYYADHDPDSWLKKKSPPIVPTDGGTRNVYPPGRVAAACHPDRSTPKACAVEGSTAVSSSDNRVNNVGAVREPPSSSGEGRNPVVAQPSPVEHNHPGESRHPKSPEGASVFSRAAEAPGNRPPTPPLSPEGAAESPSPCHSREGGNPEVAQPSSVEHNHPGGSRHPKSPEGASVFGRGASAPGTGHPTPSLSPEGATELPPATSDFAHSPSSFKLTVSERKRILLNNLFGVDIDSQAVEVTKLSLLLKVLEGQKDLALFAKERALPDLGSNIKCGNSLIGPDFFHGQQLALFDDEEKYKINAFDWPAEFPTIFKSKNPGFDTVIGNPPYDVMEKERGASSWPHSALNDYVRIRHNYEASLGGKLNLFRFFIVQGLYLLREAGRFGMIVPMAILADISCSQTRRFFVQSTDALHADCFPQKDNARRRVFLNAKLSTVVLTCTNDRLKPSLQRTIHVRVYPWNQFSDTPKESQIAIPDCSILDPEHIPIPLVDEISWKICRKIHSNPRTSRLGNIPDFSVTRGEINQTIYRKFITSDSTDSRLLKGVEVGQYNIHATLQQGSREWFDEKQFLRENTEKKIIHQVRIATQRITGVDERLRIVATLIQPPCYFADSTNSVCINPESAYRIEYLLGTLNSRLFQWRFKLTSTNNNVGTNELECMPFSKIDFEDPSQKEQHDQMVSLVQTMLNLHKSLAAAKTPHQQTALQRQIAATDSQIDALVYDLYALSPAEIALVEQATQK